MTHSFVGGDPQLVPLLKLGQSFGIRVVKSFGYPAGRATLIPLNFMSITEKSSIYHNFTTVFTTFFPQSKTWAKPGLKFRNNSRSQIESDLVKLNFGFEPQ